MNFIRENNIFFLSSASKDAFKAVTCAKGRFVCCYIFIYFINVILLYSRINISPYVIVINSPYSLGEN